MGPRQGPEGSRAEVLFFFFSFSKKKLISIFLSQWPLSLFITKTCLSDRIFPEMFFAWGGLTKFEETCHSDRIFPKNFSPAAGWLIYELHLGILFSLKKEFPNVTHKLISQPRVKKISRKIRSLRQVFPTKRENGHWDRKIRLFILQKYGKIIVSVTVNSVAPLQKNMSQWQTFGKMKLKIKKTKKKKQ